MKTLFLPIVLLIGIAANTFAQPGMGLKFNEENFQKIASFPDPDQGMKSMINAPLTADLSRYAPPVINQGKLPSCVAWSTAYNAYTVQYAAQNKIEDHSKIQNIALSAMLPYKQLRPNCEDGLDLPDIALQIMEKGNLHHSEFNGVGCAVTPGNDILNRASKYRPIMSFVKIFDNLSTNAEKTALTRKQIGVFNTPVIVGIQVTNALINLKATDSFYVPNGNVVALHAVTVVGYDTRGFKILNSWGPNWGKDGYFWVRSEDFARISLGGIALVLSNNPVPEPSARTVRVGGEFGFQYLNSKTGSFTKLTPRYLQNGVYELARKDWQIGERFQLLTNNPTARQFMCVFSIDAKNNLNVHWPKNGQLSEYNEGLLGLGVSEILPTTNFDVIIPSKTSALTIEEVGTDYLCVLYSDKPLLNELPGILSRIKNANGDIYSRLRAGLGSRLIPASNVRYTPMSMKGEAITPQGDTVPLVLKIQSVN